MRRIVINTMLIAFSSVALGKEISGPQVGDKLVPFAMRGVLDDEAGKPIDLVSDAGGRPLLIYFLHERTRQSVALARQVLNDTAARKADGLDSGLVLLASDAAAMEDWVKMATQVLPRGVPIGISSDGADGPPAYNLSRKVAVTVIVAKEGRVVANFALAQPSVNDDAAKIAEAVATVLSGTKR
jgi:hypothetical protein